MAEQRKDELGGDIYGVNENGGTSTLYVSPVSFAKIDAALQSRAEKEGKKTVRLHSPENMLEQQSPWSTLSLISPIAGAAAAWMLSGKEKGGTGDE